MSKVDYCNAVLAGLSQRELDHVQSVVNAAAHLSADAACSQLRPCDTVPDGSTLAVGAATHPIQTVRAVASTEQRHDT